MKAPDGQASSFDLTQSVNRLHKGSRSGCYRPISAFDAERAEGATPSLLRPHTVGKINALDEWAAEGEYFDVRCSLTVANFMFVAQERMYFCIIEGLETGVRRFSCAYMCLIGIFLLSIFLFRNCKRHTMISCYDTRALAPSKYQVSFDFFVDGTTVQNFGYVPFFMEQFILKRSIYK